ncbi:MAG TPA: hypothetical protein VMG99_01485 [Thermoplasmata archaeon]|nr:hypothetical protein [Thermoplasmata archaeon]
MGHARPIAFLAALTPCVEFLTGSTSAIAVLTNPAVALTFVLLTLPGYILPVLLIREALVVWRKGLSSLLALGIMYGAINEGLLAKTYFTVNPLSPPLGSPAGVGAWLGINWPWVTGITLFHMVVSISVPVVLGFLIFPETRTVRFLSARQVRVLVGLVLVEVLGLIAIQSTFSTTFRDLLPLLLLPAAIVLGGIYLARRLGVADATRTLAGRFGRPAGLVVASLVLFVVLFLPILRFFPVAFVPDVLLSTALAPLGAVQGVVLTVYPWIVAACVVRFFYRRTITDLQLAAIATGAMLIPLATAISIHDVPQGDWAAAIAYIAALVVAWRRARAHGGRWGSLGPTAGSGLAAGTGT